MLKPLADWEEIVLNITQAWLPGNDCELPETRSRRQVVKIRRWILFLPLATMISALAACGGGSTFNVQNPPPPVQQQPSIAFQGTPPQSILVNTTASLTATVTNDPSNAGVNWLLSCANTGNCGALSALHTASGTAVTYTPPLSFAGNSQPVTIVAYAAAYQAANVNTSINVTAFGSVLNGTYVFQAQGSDSNLQPYQIAGVLTLDGSGDSCSGFVTSGQQTVNTVSVGSVMTSITGSSGTPCVPGPSSYFVGGDGRGIITLSLPDPADPTSGTTITETFSVVVLSSSKALIAEVNSTSSAGTFSSVGTLELQNPAAANVLPIGGYAFVASGTDSIPNPIAYGGVVNINSSGNFLGTNSLADETVQIINQTTGLYGYVIKPCSPPNGPSGSMSWFDSSNPSSVVTFSLSTSQAAGGDCFNSALTFTGYIVDATHIRLIESDDTAASNFSGFLTSGVAIGQTGVLTNASFKGPYVFDVVGITPANGVIPSSLTAVGVVCPDGVGGLTSCTDASGNPSGGYMDTLFFYDNVPLPGGVNSLCPAAPCPGQISAEISTAATYHIDGHGIGRVGTANLKPNPQPNATHPFNPNVVFYLTGNGTPPLVLLAGGASQSYPALGIGMAYPQQQPASALFFGNGELYGVSFTQQPGTEVDGSGQMTSTLNQGSPGGILSGLVDESNGAGFGNSLADSFACPQGASSCPDPFGRFSNSTFLGTGAAYYLIDDNSGFFVETDLNSNFEAGLTPQVALGYIAQRCDVTVTDPTNPNYCQPAAAQSSSRKHALKEHRSRMHRED